MEDILDAISKASLPYINILVGMLWTAVIAFVTALLAYARRWLLVRGVVVAAVETEKASGGVLSGAEKKTRAMGIAKGKHTLLNMTISGAKHEKLMEDHGVPAANEFKRKSLTPPEPK